MQLNVLSNPSSVLLSTHAERNSTAAPRYPQEIISAARISSSFSTCSLVNHRANMMKWPALGAPDVCGLSASPRLRSSNRRLDVGGRHMAATCHPSRPREQRGLGSVGCGAGGRPEIEAPQRPTRPASAAGSARHNTASARREWPEGGSEGLLFPPPLQVLRLFSGKVVAVPITARDKIRLVAPASYLRQTCFLTSFGESRGRLAALCRHRAPLSRRKMSMATRADLST